MESILRNCRKRELWEHQNFDICIIHTNVIWTYLISSHRFLSLHTKATGLFLNFWPQHSVWRLPCFFEVRWEALTCLSAGVGPRKFAVFQVWRNGFTIRIYLILSGNLCLPQVNASVNFGSYNLWLFGGVLVVLVRLNWPLRSEN